MPPDTSAQTSDSAQTGASDQMGMRDALLDLGNQMRLAADNAAAASKQVTQQLSGASAGASTDAHITNVMLAGMGGSGIAGDVAQAVGEPSCPVPITVVKGYECPVFVGPSTLVVALSFSGNTEETLSVARAAHDSGARLVAVSSGGELARLAGEWGAPCYEVDSSIPMPRAAVGAMAVPPLLALAAAGLLSDAPQQIDEAITQVGSRLMSLAASAVALPQSPAVQDSLLLVCGAGNLGAAAALRWKTQINENAKLPALLGVLPELCHNELAGWEVAPDIAQRVQPYFLRHGYEHPQNKKRFEFYADVLTDAGVRAPIEVHATGGCEMAQLFDLVVLGDDFSLRLAAALGRDPGPVDILMDLKAHLGKK